MQNLLNKELTKLGVFVFSMIGLVLFGLINYASAITSYPPGALLQPNDVTSSHIRDNTIVNADISTSAAISATKVAGGTPAGDIMLSNGTGLATSTSLHFATTTKDLYVFSGRIHATSTNFNGVNQTWPSADGSNGQYLKTNGSGTLSWNTVSTGFGVFGDATDSAAAFDGTTEISGASRSGSVYTLTRDMYVSSSTISSGVTVNTASYRIFGTNTCTISGTLHNNGGAGGNGGSSTGGTAGAAALDGTIASSTPGAVGSGTGGGSSAIAITHALGARGGKGSDGGQAGATTTASVLPHSLDRFLRLTDWTFTAGEFPYRGGSGGGGGDGYGTNGGGGGGGGGGIMFISCSTINVTASGIISADGGAGGNGLAGAPSGGAGGGGGGGAVILISQSYTNSGSVRANGGTVGTGSGTPVAGNSGTVYTITQ